jgi:hypothetical protein
MKVFTQYMPLFPSSFRLRPGICSATSCRADPVSRMSPFDRVLQKELVLQVTLSITSSEERSGPRHARRYFHDRRSRSREVEECRIDVAVLERCDRFGLCQLLLVDVLVGSQPRPSSISGEELVSAAGSPRDIFLPLRSANVLMPVLS